MMLSEKQSHDGKVEEARPVENSQETGCVDISDFGSLRKVIRRGTWLLPSNPEGLPGLRGVRLSAPPQTKLPPDH